MGLIKQLERLFSGAGTASLGSAAAKTAVHSATEGLTKEGLYRAAWDAAIDLKSKSRNVFSRTAGKQDYSTVAQNAINERISNAARASALEKLKTEGVNIGGGQIKAYTDLSTKEIREELAELTSRETDRIKDALNITNNEIVGMGTKIGTKVEKGNPFIRIPAGVVKKHPIAAPIAIGAAGYGLLTSGSGLLSLITSPFNAIANLGGDGIGNPLSAGLNTLTGGFNGVSNVLEYVGMDPQWAHIVTFIGTWLTMGSLVKGGLSFSGLDKVLPGGLTNFGVAIGTGLLALQIASGSSEPAATASGPKQTDVTVNQPPLAPTPQPM